MITKSGNNDTIHSKFSLVFLTRLLGRLGRPYSLSQPFLIEMKYQESYFNWISVDKDLNQSFLWFAAMEG